MGASVDPKRQPVSAFVVCFNEERHIRDCLDSLSFCDEIVVVDSHSTDATPAIAEEMGARVIQREWPGYRAQKEFGLSQVSHDWVINIDADERVSPELAQSILRVLEGDPPGEQFAGYRINRVVFYLDRWWRRGGWYPEFRLRFFRKSKVEWGGVDPHEKPIPKGDVVRLEGEIQHFTYDDMNSQFRQLLHFADIAARQDYQQGRAPKLRYLLLSPIARFFRFYVLKQGFREGTAGLIVAIAESYYTFAKYARLWELDFNSKHRTTNEGQGR